MLYMVLEKLQVQEASWRSVASIQLSNYLPLGDLCGLSSVIPISQILSPKVSSCVPFPMIPITKHPFNDHLPYLDPFISLFLNLLSYCTSVPILLLNFNILNRLHGPRVGLDLSPHAIAPKVFPTGQLSLLHLFSLAADISQPTRPLSPSYH